MPTADAIASALAARGTRACFGVPGGGANLDLVGACARHGIRFVLMHGETSAVIAAAVHGELAGAPGLALCTRGPGLASAVNGLAQATLDRQAVVLVTDGAGHAYSHQRLDHAALAAPVAKGTVADPDAAVALALAQPPGAVVIDAGAAARATAAAPGPVAASRPALALPPARRPLVVAGVGARGAEPALRRLVAGTRIPVLETYRAKGTIPWSWPNAAGLFTGATLEAPLLRAADLILLVGVDPVELIPAPWPYAAPTVAIAPWTTGDPYIPLGAEVVGDVADLLERLRLDGSGWERDGRAFRLEAEARLRASAAGFGPHAVVDAVARALPPGARTTVDAGAHMLVAMPLLPAEEPRSCLISSGLATMGFALPAAIGAAVADGAPVVCLTGDGGLGMCLGELETLVRLDLDVRVVVLDDATLSLIAIKQGPGQGGAEAVRYGRVDFAGVARAAGLRATEVADADALETALAARGPSLVAARIDPSAYAAVLEATRGGRREP